MSQWRARRSTNSNGVKPARRLASPHWTACSLFPNRSRVNDLPIPTPDPTRPDPSDPPYLRGLTEIGRASCRERVCLYVSISVVAVALKTNILSTKRHNNHSTQQKK